MPAPRAKLCEDMVSLLQLRSQSYWLLLRKKSKAAWSERSLRLVCVWLMEHRTSAWCSVLSFPSTQMISHSSQLMPEKNPVLCISKRVVGSCKTVNLEIWPQLKIISSKIKWTLRDKETIFIQMYPGMSKGGKWNSKYILLQNVFK